MNVQLFEKLSEEGLISPGSLQKVKTPGLFSLHWELKTLLYLGVLLLSGGLGILIYKNIDTIGHQAILFAIAAVCLGCFYYAKRHKPAFSWNKTLSPNGFFDYIVLLGCLLFVTFITYMQAQYNVFGTRYGLAAFFPMIVLFFSAYYFDHIGVLSLAITNFAAWLGVSITPYHIFSQNDFSSHRLIYTGLLLGVILIAAGLLSTKRNIKQHFSFTYHNFGVHILFIALLSALFVFDATYFLWFLLLAGVATAIYFMALKNRSFYFLLITILYAYVGLSYVVVWLLLTNSSIEGIYLGLFYFIGSGIGVAVFLVNLNKKLKHHDSL
ncbi:DUF2157 domain-containing protein [Chitinophaga sp. SYP-B3965]|uniref:DUF2157 domain-containing protein n=1 Tax=Chitinophaga sp. SYP-B3965 TaxID=2663120 RepID=UPI001299D744|nr:DUF2157 domain-containing protein [Chitinophaga sp. SYP-B3965]MRG44280.1 DUF2157 domain-containing protein [Chitinophaga sp. SYP-B3965]